MPATREGKVVSLGMKDTVVVEVFRMFVHPLYKKRIKRSQKYQAHYTGDSLKLGDTVKIIETRPISKNKHFKVMGDHKKQVQPKEVESKVEKKALKKAKK